jgi:hypothetical protein
MNAKAISGNRLEAKIALLILLWGLACFFSGYYKLFTIIPRTVFGIIIVVIQISLVILYISNKRVKEFCNSIPLKSITLFHVWRIFAGWVFLSFSGILSPTFINNAAYGDIIAGFLALSVFVFGHTKFNYYLFNVIGLLDFFIAVGTGIALTITRDPLMGPLIDLPLIMIPLFGVPLSGITHFISLSQLLKMKNIKLTDRIA